MSARVQALRAAPAPRSPEREKLAQAIERHVAATAELAKIANAKSRATRPYEISERIREAEKALEDAKAAEPARLVGALLEGDDGEQGTKDSPIIAAHALVRELRQAEDRAESVLALLSRHEEEAKTELSWALQHRDEALRAAVMADPALQALRDRAATARRELVTYEQCLIAAGASDTTWLYSLKEVDAERIDEWRVKVFAMTTDPDAPLPAVS